MADLTPGQRRAMFYWGDIEAATLAGESTGQIWDRIRAHQDDPSSHAPAISATDVGWLRSKAVELRNAGSQLAQLGAEDMITGQVIPTAPWARELQSRNTVGMWQVRFEHQTESNGVLSTNWRTIMFQGDLPRTRAELEAAIEGDAIEIANKYNVTHVAVGNYTLFEV